MEMSQQSPLYIYHILIKMFLKIGPFKMTHRAKCGGHAGNFSCLEGRKIMVQGQPRQKVTETPSQPINQAWWFIPEIQLCRRWKQEAHGVRPAQAKEGRPLKQNKQN
jgi:hypothetical protein